MVAVRRGTPLVIVNLTETPLDGAAALVVRGRAGEVLPPAVELAARLA
jgi:NAD-dependent SIR2 family protein deacetylase